ncbi:MAG: inorganic pyrophosphatase [Francisellaceae bacterium]|nr:inorganic pyrophosphatase [Francisellaceae bacterium]
MLNDVKVGSNLPHEVNVIIEIPAHSEPVKYEIDKYSGVPRVDRFMTTCMRYPCDYGYIPQTLSEDGDPVDALVVSPYPLLSGSVIMVRPIGLLNMTDEAGKDTKILAVPIDRLTPLYRHILKPDDLFPLLLQQIVFFFKHYKDLEDGKWVTIEGWEGPEAAKAEILAGIERHKNNKPIYIE